MKVSTKGRYGLLVMVDLASHEQEAPISLKSIAERHGLSDNYLEQLMAPLRNAGLVRSIRGAYGGYILAKPKTAISVADIFLTLEGPILLMDSDVEDGLDELWGQLENSLMGVLESLTLQDLVEMGERSKKNYMYYI